MLFNGTDTGAPLKHALLSYNISHGLSIHIFGKIAKTTTKIQEKEKSMRKWTKQSAEDYIKKCISSICTQSVSELQIILVDDGSTDNSLEICRQLQKNDNRIECHTIMTL